jgi:hypothetical protein
MRFHPSSTSQSVVPEVLTPVNPVASMEAETLGDLQE